MVGKIDISFTCHETTFDDTGKTTVFLFYPAGQWDEDKKVIEEALRDYPVDQYNWIHDESE